MIVGDMEIRLRADIARLQRDMDSARQVVGNATAGMERAANAAKGAIAGIAAGFGFQQFASMVDEYQKFTAQLRLATQSQREYATAYAEVKRISTQSTQGLQETGVLYARIANGTRELGVAQRQVAAITETVNLALLVSGATASESASAQLQLSQAFAAGALRGEEFNAVNEAAPRLMQALADGIGVPVGALKKMAEEGKITTDVMTRALGDEKLIAVLREQGKEIQTIGGAFTVLKNNVMEFVGIQANASGAVSGVVSAIGLLSNNLGLLAGVITTLAASKLTTMFAGWGVETYKQVVANAALRTSTLAGAVASTEAAATISAAKLAEAQANVQAAATAANLANARVAELRSAVLAAEGAVALAVATNGLIPAQTRAIALSEAHSIALAQQAVAGNAATVAAGAAGAALTAQAAATGVAARAMGVLRGAMMFMGGPIGAIVTLLGLGATAWMVWGNSAKEANDKTAQSVEETHEEVISRIQKQIDKLNERAALAKAQPNLKVENAADLDRLAKLWTEYNDAKNGTGKFANATAEYRGVFERIALREHAELLKNLTGLQAAQTTVAQKGVDARVAAFMKENASKKEQMAAELKAIEDLKGKTGEYEEMVRRIRAKYAEKGNEQAIKQEATAYQNLVTSIGEKAAANELELNGYAKLSDSQKMSIKLDEAIASGKNKLTPAHVAETRALIAKVAAQESAIEEGAFYLQQAEQQAQLSAAAIKAADDEADRNEELARTFGMSKVAIEQITLARLEEKLAQADTSKGYTREIAELEAVIDAKKRSVAALGELEGMEALQKATEKARADQVQLWESIEKTAHDTFISIFDSGKSAFDRLKDALKNGLYELLYQMTVKKWIINISGQMSGMGGLAQAGSALGGEGGSSAGSIFSSASSLVNMGKTIYSGFTGGISGTLGGWATSAGSMFGSSAVSSFGAGLSAAGGNTGMAAMYASAQTSGNLAAGASAGMSAGTYAIPIAGWIAAGMALSNNLYKQGWDANNGTVNSLGKVVNAPMFLANNILKGIGLSDSAANIFAGMGPISKLFGRKNPEIEEGGVRGSVTASGFSGENYANILEKGGWFRSDKRYTQTNALSADQQSGFSDSTKALMDAARGFASTLGVEANIIDGYNKQITLQLGADEEKNKEAIAKLFGEIGDDLSLLILPSVASFSTAGESVSTTLQRLVSDYATIDEAFTAIGTTFGAVGVSSLGAREQFLAAAGGVEAFATSTAFFHQNFLSEAERNAPVMKAVTEQMAALGLASVDTRAEFKDAVLDLVNSGALTTEEGAKRYAALMKVQDGFAQVYPEIDRTVAALDTATAMLELQAQIYELTGDKAGAAAVLAQQHAAALAALDPALRGATQQLWDLQAAAKSTEQVKASASALLGGVDGAFSALQKVVEREKTAVQSSVDAHTASVTKLQSLSQALRSTLDGMQSPEQKLGARAEGQAQLRAALAIAQAGGPLPGADSLKNALAAVQQDASNQFSLYTDYLRDVYKTQNDIGALAGITDIQLSVDEKALKAAQDQLEALDAVLKNAQALIDETKGQSTTLISIEQAIQALYGAVAAANANPVVSAGTAINNAYQQYLGRAPDAEGFEWWKNAAAGGAPIGQIVGGIANSTEADLNRLYKEVLGRAPDAEGLAFWKSAYGSTMSEAEKADWLKAAQEDAAVKVPGFANGGDFAGGVRAVGEVGVEIEATGPARIHSTQSLMDALRNPPRDSDALAAAVDRLSMTVERQNVVIAQQGAALDQIQRNTRRQADTLDVVTEGGKGMRNQEATAQ